MGNDYEDECRRSLAKEQAKSLAATNNWEHVDRERVHQDWDVLYREITAHLDNGSLPGDQQVQELVRRHFDIACRFGGLPTNSNPSIQGARTVRPCPPHPHSDVSIGRTFPRRDGSAIRSVRHCISAARAVCGAR
ncbi:TipAS antibiotic-recognition domain-containing protein [Streptomyces longwoodensis]